MGTAFLMGQSGGANKVYIVATGGVVTTDGNYKIHTFLSNGTFTVIDGYGDIEYLIVAGGGGGGSYAYSAGGGAGGFLSDIAPLISTGDYPIIVGNGGNGASAASPAPRKIPLIRKRRITIRLNPSVSFV